MYVKEFINILKQADYMDKITLYDERTDNIAYQGYMDKPIPESYDYEIICYVLANVDEVIIGIYYT